MTEGARKAQSAKRKEKNAGLRFFPARSRPVFVPAQAREPPAAACTRRQTYAGTLDFPLKRLIVSNRCLI
jgi:hypothetical protein